MQGEGNKRSAQAFCTEESATRSTTNTEDGRHVPSMSSASTAATCAPSFSSMLLLAKPCSPRWQGGGLYSSDKRNQVKLGLNPRTYTVHQVGGRFPGVRASVGAVGHWVGRLRPFLGLRKAHKISRASIYGLVLGFVELQSDCDLYR